MSWKTDGQHRTAFLSVHKISTRLKEERDKFLGTRVANAATWNEWHRKMQQQAPVAMPVEMQVIMLMDRGTPGVPWRGCDAGVTLDAIQESTFLKEHCLNTHALVRQFSLLAEWHGRNCDGEQLTGSGADTYVKQRQREALLDELHMILDGCRWQKGVQ